MKKKNKNIILRFAKFALTFLLKDKINYDDIANLL